MLPEKQMHARGKNTVPQCSACSSSEQNTPNETGKWPHKHQLRKETHRQPLERSFPPESSAPSRRQPCQPSSGLRYWPMQHMIPTSSALCSFSSSAHCLILPFKTSELLFSSGKGEPRSDQGFSWLTQSSNTPFFKKTGANSPYAVRASKTVSPLALPHNEK